MDSCEQCGGRSRAPPEIGVCERCRHRNVHELRELYAAAAALASIDLAALPGRVTYPFRAPLTSTEAARLASAARELQAAVLELPDRPELRERLGPRRAEVAHGTAEDEARRRGRAAR